MTWLESIFPHAYEIQGEFITAIWETIYMTALSSMVGGFFGLILGILLLVSRPGGLWENSFIYNTLDGLVNLTRSIPFIILLALLINVTRFIVGKTTGPTAASVAIIAGTIPFYARQVEIALLEVDPGVVEAAEAMGASPWEIIWSVYLKEGLPALIRVTASTVINIVGLTAMAGTVGGGGLGTVAIARGYQRSRYDVILVATVLILLLVFISQLLFKAWLYRVEHYRRK